MDPHLRPLAVVLAFMCAYAAIIVLAVRWARGARTRRAQSVADSLAAAGADVKAVRRPSGTQSAAIVDFVHDGKPGSFEIRPYMRDWSLLSLTLASAPLPHVLIRRERGADRLGKSLGFNREVQIGDEPFDAAAFIDTAESDDLVRRLLDKPEVRAAVLDVMGTGYSVEMSPAGLRATRRQSRLEPIDGAAIAAAMKRLQALAPILPSFDAASFTKPHWLRSTSMVYVAIAVAFGGLVAAGASIGRIRTIAVREDVAYAFALGLGCWLLLVAGLFFALRGGTRSLTQLVLTALTLLCGVPLAVTLLAFVANSALDPSPPVVHHTTVLAVPSRIRSRNNQVTFASWRADHDRLIMGVPYARVATLSVGDSVDVVTHAGAFGWEWIEEFR